MEVRPVVFVPDYSESMLSMSDVSDVSDSSSSDSSSEEFFDVVLSMQHEHDLRERKRQQRGRYELRQRPVQQ
jgi:hypothetical protein